ncbi:hypothetical protein ACTXLT_09140 [Brachybacterium alimentarium]|uniref:hypothetical protein n=1 Tax=Brachybacterium alimentarium TaxID=47845 RepID=UPI00403DF1AF
MTLHQATAEHFEILRELDRENAQRRQRVAVAEAGPRAVADYWRSMPRPYAVATNAEPNRTYPGHYVVTVQCPYCPQQHTHGWTGPGDTGGHRAPDCADPLARQINSRGYIVTIPADLDVPR